MTNTNRRKAPKHERETFEFAAMVRRMLRAHGRRVADADPEDLSELVGMRETLDAAIADAVVGQKMRGDSWAEIARGLGTSRQYAQRAYGVAVADAERAAIRAEMSAIRAEAGAA